VGTRVATGGWGPRDVGRLAEITCGAEADRGKDHLWR
jgi:hypothetical protein